MTCYVSSLSAFGGMPGAQAEVQIPGPQVDQAIKKSHRSFRRMTRALWLHLFRARKLSFKSALDIYSRQQEFRQPKNDVTLVGLREALDDVAE